MNIEINHLPKTLQGDSLTVAEVIKACGLPEQGIAVALNNKVVKRLDWTERTVKSGDSLTMITAVCGG